MLLFLAILWLACFSPFCRLNSDTVVIRVLPDLAVQTDAPSLRVPAGAGTDPNLFHGHIHAAQKVVIVVDSVTLVANSSNSGRRCHPQGPDWIPWETRGRSIEWNI